MGALSRYAIVGMLLGLGLAIVYVLMSAAGGKPETARFEAFATGELAGLDFSAVGAVPEPVAFLSPQEVETVLGDFKGKTVLVNLWATWCPPCQREMPSLGALQTARGGADFDVIAISVDSAEDADFSRKELDRLTGGAIEFYHAPDFAVTYAMGVTGFPTTVLYGPGGQEIARLTGEADWSSLEVVGFIDAVLDAYK